MSPVHCVVAYPAKTPAGEPAKFDMEYYLSNHMPMIDRFWGPHGMKKWDVFQYPAQNPLDGKDAPYLVQTILEFESVEGIKAAFTAPEIKTTMADVANYTDAQAVIWISTKTGSSTL